jgi:2-amino-4-hydroxy-6-hydroxymethyldihydropteridine diphosphokinase
MGELTGLSGVYESDAVGFEDQPPFLNLVARLETELGPEALLERLRVVEAERGRERSFRNAPRTLDIDILLYDDVVLDVPGLTIPHPRMTGRSFVLAPLLELDPDLEEPGTGRRFADLRPGEPAGIRRLYDGARLLGEEAKDDAERE